MAFQLDRSFFFITSQFFLIPSASGATLFTSFIPGAASLFFGSPTISRDRASSKSLLPSTLPANTEPSLFLCLASSSNASLISRFLLPSRVVDFHVENASPDNQFKVFLIEPQPP